VSRAVLAWRLSNTLGADFCVEALEAALSRYGRPEIFNTDQESQFTSDDFTGILKRHGVTISMDGKSLPSQKRGAAAWTTSSSSGCGAASNTRVDRNAYARVAEAKAAIGAGLPFDNEERQQEPRLSHAAANLRRRPVDMGTSGVADRLCFPRQLDKRGDARLRPHTHRRRSQQKN